MKEPLGRPRHSWKDKNETELKKCGLRVLTGLLWHRLWHRLWTPSGCTKGGELLDQLSDYQLLSDSPLYGVVCGEEPLLSHRLSKTQENSTVVENTE
jgi:hypothetical protein